MTLLKSPAPSPPSPKGRFFVGNLPDYYRDPLSFLSYCARDYGDMVCLRFGPIVSYMVNHPDSIEEVLVTKHSQFHRALNRGGSECLFGNGLLTSEGEFWRRQRRAIQPGFHRDRIAAYADTMIRYTGQMLATWKSGDTLDIHEEMMHLTLILVAKTLFDTELTEDVEAINVALTTLTQHFNESRDSNAQLLGLLLPAWVPTPQQMRFRKAVQQLDQIVYRIIHEHRDEQQAGDRDRGDLLSMLMHVQDSDGSAMDDQLLRDEVMNLLLAGHETTANGLSWTWMLLSQHPEVEAKLLEELQSVLGDRPPTLADLPQLRYTERVVMESMRLYPPVWAASRQTVQDCEIGGYPIPANTIVFVSQWLMHRDPRYFDNPETFDPDRWANDLAKRLPTYAYFPFGGGPRICIGKSFAMMESVLLVAMIAQQFKLTLVPDHPIELQPSITLRPRYGMKMTLTRRSPQNSEPLRSTLFSQTHP